MRRTSWLGGLLLATTLIPPLALGAGPDRLESFAQGRLGLSISWGVWTILGKGESVITDDTLPAREYEKLLALFKPAGFQADEWAGFARAAGARYLVVPAKGPDGLCFFQTRTTDYDVVDATPFARDPLKLLSEACQKQNIALGVSFSMRDGHHPHARAGGTRARYLADCKAQIEELTTQYGELQGIWLEGVEPGRSAEAELAEIVATIRKHQPNALVVRVGQAPASPGVDVASVESGEGPAGLPFERVASFPPLATGEATNVRSLVADLARTAARGGNYRLIVRPRADGLIPSDQVERLKELGSWLEKNGEAIYRTVAGPIVPRPWGVSTRSRTGSTVYLHVLDPGVPLTIPPEPKGFEARLFHSTQPLPVSPIADGYRIDLAESLRTPNATVVAIRRTR